MGRSLPDEFVWKNNETWGRTKSSKNVLLKAVSFSPDFAYIKLFCTNRPDQQSPSNDSFGLWGTSAKIILLGETRRNTRFSKGTNLKEIYWEKQKEFQVGLEIKSLLRTCLIMTYKRFLLFLMCLLFPQKDFSCLKKLCSGDFFLFLKVALRTLNVTLVLERYLNTNHVVLRFILFSLCLNSLFFDWWCRMIVMTHFLLKIREVCNKHNSDNNQILSIFKSHVSHGLWGVSYGEVRWWGRPKGTG